jgi:hypothetical protein
MRSISQQEIIDYVEKILRSNTTAAIHIVAVNGCCYGRDNQPDKGDYIKLCGQKFWAFISGDEQLYTNIVEPLGYKAKEQNEEFAMEYAKVINKFTLEFIQAFCDLDGGIQWKKLVEFNSSQQT